MRILLFAVLLLPQTIWAVASISESAAFTARDGVRDYLDIGCVHDGAANVAPANGDFYTVTYDNTATGANDTAHDLAPSVTLPAGIVLATATPQVSALPGSCTAPASVSVSGSSLILDASDYDLEPGCAITIAYEIYADVTAGPGVYTISDTLSYSNNEGGSAVGSMPGSSLSLAVNAGQSVISKTPQAPDDDVAAVGDTINWDVTVTNTGTGGLCDVEVVDTPSAIALATPLSVTTPYIAAGGDFTFTATGTVNSCEGISNNVAVYHALFPSSGGVFGADADSAITLDLETPLINFTSGPNDIAALEFDAQETVCVDIENAGRGDAVSVVITPILPGGFSIVDTSGADWSFNGTSFAYIPAGGVVGDSVMSQLCFDVLPNEVCDVIEGGSIIWASNYEDRCGNPYALPTDISAVPNTSGHPEIVVTKGSGTDGRIDVGESASWVVSVTLANSDKLDSNNLVIADNLDPSGALIQSTGAISFSGNSAANTENCGGCITGAFNWVIPAVDVADGTYIMTMPYTVSPDQCDAGNFVTNAVDLSYSYTVGSTSCDLVASDASSTFITNNSSSSGGGEQNFNVNGGANANIEAGFSDGTVLGDQVSQITEGEIASLQATYEFEAGFTGTWGANVVYTDNLGGLTTFPLQEIVANSLSFTVSGCAAATTETPINITSDGTSGNILAFHFGGTSIDGQLMAGCTLSIDYSTTVQRDPADAAWRRQFATQISELAISGLSAGSGGCEGTDVTYTQALFLNVWRADPSVEITLPPAINVCEPFSAEIFVDHNGNNLEPTQDASPYDPSNIILQLDDASSAYTVNPSFTFDGGLITDTVTQSTTALGTLFTHSNAASVGNELSADGRVYVPMVLTTAYTSGLPGVGVTMSYDDNQAQIPVSQFYNESSSDAPILINQAELAITVSPQTFVMTNDMMTYTIYVTNTGPSPAFGATTTDVIASGFTLDIAATDAANAAPATGTNTRPTSGVTLPSGVPTWELGDISPGNTVQIEVVATIDAGRDCSPTTDGEIQALWGCGTTIVTDATKDNPKLIFPSGALLVQHLPDNSQGDLCSDDYVTLLVSNTGITSIYDITVDEDLQTASSGLDFAAVPAFEYCVGEASADDCTTNGAWQNITSPAPSGGTISLNSTNISELAELVPQSEADNTTSYSQVFIRFLVNVGESAILANDPVILADAAGEIACGEPVTAAQSPYPYTINQPQLSVLKRGQNPPGLTAFPNNVYGELNDVVRWRIEITNNGNATAQHVRVEDILPTNSISTPAAATILDEAFVPLGSAALDIFAIQDIDAGDTATYYIDQPLDNQCVNDFNQATVSYGCVNNGATVASNLLPDTHPDFSDTRNRANLIMNPQINGADIAQTFTPLGGGRTQVDIVLDYTGGPVTIGSLSNTLADTAYEIENNAYSWGLNAAATTNAETFDAAPIGSPPTYIFDDLAGEDVANNDMLNIRFIVTTNSYEDTAQDPFENEETDSAGNSLDPDFPPAGNNIVSIQLDNSCGDMLSALNNSETFDPATPDLDITVSPESDVVNSGVASSYSFTIINNGDTDSIADNATFTLDVGAGWTGAGVTTTGGINCTGTAPSFTCTLPALGFTDGQSGTVVFTGMPTNTGSLALDGQIVGEIANTTGPQRYSLDTATPKIVGFDVTKTFLTGTSSSAGTDDATTPPSLTIGETVQFEITAEWFGLDSGDTVSNTIVADVLPAGFGFISQTHSGWVGAPAATVTPSLPAVGDNGTVSYAIGDHENATFTATIEVVVLNNAATLSEGTAPQTVTNPADVSFTLLSENYDQANYPELHQEEDVQILHPELVIEKRVRNATQGGAFAATATGDAGDVFEYELVITNNGDSPLYDITVDDQFATSQLQLLSTGVGADCTVNDTNPDQLLCDELDLSVLEQLDGDGTTITLLYEAEALLGVMPDDMLDNAVVVTGSSIDDNDNSNTAPEDELILTQNDTASVTTNGVSFDKTIIATSNPDTGAIGLNEGLAIGEQVEFEITMELPEGTINNLAIRDTLPANMVFIGATAGFGTNGAQFGASSNAATSSFTSSGAGPTLLEWSFTNVQTDAMNGGTIADRTLTICYVAQVLNSAINTDGVSFTNAAQFDLGSGFSTAVQVPMEIEETTLTITKVATPDANLDAGDVVTFTITVENTGSIPAYNVSVIDALPAGLTFVDPPAPSSSTSTVPTESGNIVALGRDEATPQDVDIPANSIIEFTFAATLDTNVKPNEVLTNDVTVDWHSMDNLTDTLQHTLGAAGTPTGPRDGSDETSSADPNDYYTITNDTLSVVNNFSLEKALTDPAVTEFTIGDEIDYTLTLTFQEGTVDNVVVHDILPAGLGYVAGSSNATLGTSITATVPAAVADGSASCANGIVCFDIGTVVHDGTTANGDTDTIILTYRAVVLDDNMTFPVPNGAAAPDVVQSNNASLSWEDVSSIAFDDTDNNVNVTIEQPYLTISKSLVPTAPTEFVAGDAVTFALLIENTGTGTAYDITVQDNLPEGLNDAAPALNAAGLVNITTGDITQNDLTATAGVPPRTTQWEIDPAYGLEGGQSFTLEYTVMVDDNVAANQLITNSAEIPAYTSHPDDSNNDRRDYVGDNSTLASITTPGMNDITKAVDLAEANIGDRVTYSFTVPVTLVNTEANNVVITDTLPAGLLFDYDSFVIDGANNTSSGASNAVPVITTPTGTGNNVAVTIATLDPNEQAVFTIEAVVENIASNNDGVVLNNTASFNYDENIDAISGNPVGPIDSNEVSTTVTEPQLSVDKTFLSATFLGQQNMDIQLGTEITYQFDITHTGNSTGTAYDITLTDIAHVWLQNPQLGGVDGGDMSTSSTCTNPRDLGINADNSDIVCDWALTHNGSLPVGNALSFTITFTLNDYIMLPVPPGFVLPVRAYENFINQADLAWTSTDSDNDDERDGSEDSAEDDYNTSSGIVTSITGSVSFTKTLYDPDNPNTPLTDNNFAVGETVQYLLTFTGALGSYDNLTLTDNLPTGLEFVSAAIQTDMTQHVQQAGGSGFAIQSTPAPGATGAIAIAFGNVESPTGSNPAESMVVAVVVDALISDVALVDGEVLPNRATASSTDPNFQTPAEEAAPITIIVPALVLSLYGDDGTLPTDVTPGITQIFTADIQHEAGSTSTAYQPEVTLSIPPEFCVGPPVPAINTVSIMPDGIASGRTVTLATATDYTASFVPPAMAGDPCSMIVTLLSDQAYLGLDSSATIQEMLRIQYALTLNTDVTNGTAVASLEANITGYHSVDVSTELLAGDPVPSSVAIYDMAGGTVSTAPQTIGDDERDDHPVNVLAATVVFNKTVYSITPPGGTEILSTNPGFDAGNVAPDSVVVYEITVTNSGGADATDVSISDIIPPEFLPGTLGSFDPAPAAGSITFPNGTVGTLTVDATGGTHNTGTFTLSDMTVPDDAGSNAITLRYAATLLPSVPNDSPLVNAALLMQTGFSYQFADATIVIDSTPILEIEKISAEIIDGTAPLESGETLQYSMTIRNVGDEMLVNAIITDTVPSNTSYVANSMTVDGSAVVDITAGILPLSTGYSIDNTSNAGELEAQTAGGMDVTITFEVTIDDNLVPGTPITNTATISGNPESTPGSNPLSQEDETQDIVGDVPAIEAIKTYTSNPNLAADGATLTYTITIENYGAADATNVVFTDPLPANTTFASSGAALGNITYNNVAQTSTPGDDDAEISGTDVVVTIGTLAPGDVATVTFDVVIDAGATASPGFVSNQGMVSSNELPDELTDVDGNDSDGDEPTITPLSTAPLLRSTKNVTDINGGMVMPGDELEYTVTVVNYGTVDAQNVTVIDAGPSPTLVGAVTYFAFNNVPNTALSFGAAWPMGTVAANGGSASYTYRVAVSGTAQNGDSIINQAVFDADNVDCSGSSSSAGALAVGPCISDSVLNDDSETGNIAGDPNDDDPTIVQVGAAPGVGSLEGTVWQDADHDRSQTAADTVLEGWTVVLSNGGTMITNITTNASGGYSFFGMAPGNGYEITFYPPASNVPWGYPLSGSDTTPDGLVYGPMITQLNLLSGTILPNQDLPVDPTGVMYNAITRQPVAGAVVEFFDGSGALLGPDCIHADQQGQITEADGWYQMDILPGCPNMGGDFVINVTPPPGYLPFFPSSFIPDSGTHVAPTGPTPDVITVHNQEPQLGEDTTYFATLTIDANAGNVVNNHLPIDPILEGALIVSKTTPKPEAARGDLVPYTITIQNTLDVTIPNVSLIDLLPPGFKYIEGSATIDGAAAEPEQTGRTLTWSGLDVPPTPQITIKFLAIIGSGVSEGEYINQAYAQDGFSGTRISNIAEAAVRIIPDPIFDCPEVVGRVFDDTNSDGYPDKGEPGIAAVRLFNTYGLKITTDSHGRFHVPCAMIPNAMRGSNYTLKLDTRSLPTGYHVTSENPRTIRLTRGKMSKLNFGASLMRVIHVGLTDALFSNEADKQAMLRDVVARSRNGPALVHITYESEYTHQHMLQGRLDTIKDAIKRMHDELPSDTQYELRFELETRILHMQQEGRL